MVAHDWLVGYASRTGMLDVCRSMDARLEQRLAVTSPLHRLFEAADSAGFETLEGDFKAFWHRIQGEANEYFASHDLPTFTAWQLK
jgi:acyl carrier protein phosphodiesterase